MTVQRFVSWLAAVLCAVVLCANVWRSIDSGQWWPEVLIALLLIFATVLNVRNALRG